MDITAFIRELLFGHDCVIIPGFGGFIGNYVPARIDKVSNTLYPPVKQISFNRNLNHNDGLLIGRISETKGLNYGDARNLVENFVTDLRSRLGKGEKVVFGNIGTFWNNSEGNVQFEPDREANYHLNSYGLASFQMMPLEGYDLRTRIIKKDKDPVRNESVRKYLWRAAVIIPLLGLMIVVPLKTDLLKNKVQSTSLNPLASVEMESNKQALSDSGRSETVTPVIKTDSDKTNTDAVTPPAENKEPGTLSTDEFSVIAGSFRSEENASVMINKLKAEGFSPELIQGPNGFYRVCAVRCSSLSEAIRKKDSIGTSYSGTWITKTR